MLELAIGTVATLLGVAVGCTVLELAMRALRRSIGSYGYEQRAEGFQTQPSLVAWDGEQIPARIPSLARADPLVRARNSVRL